MHTISPYHQRYEIKTKINLKFYNENKKINKNTVEKYIREIKLKN